MFLLVKIVSKRLAYHTKGIHFAFQLKFDLFQLDMFHYIL